MDESDDTVTYCRDDDSFTMLVVIEVFWKPELMTSCAALGILNLGLYSNGSFLC